MWCDPKWREGCGAGGGPEHFTRPGDETDRVAIAERLFGQDSW